MQIAAEASQEPQAFSSITGSKSFATWQAVLAGP